MSKGHVQEIVHYDGETKSIRVDQKGLESVLLNPAIRDMPVAVLCVAGIFRSGKSFLLNFFLSYLSQEDESGEVPKDWIKHFPDGDDGFVWKGGAERVTTGIAAWSEPFIRNINGTKAAVLLMDTQGTFDHQSTMQENIRIFSLGALLGSLLINNIPRQVSEDKLQQLELFVKFGQMVREKDNTDGALQSLCFLVRDWQDIDSFPFGIEGGQQYINNVLSTEGKGAELTDLRKSISSSFEHIYGCLLPSPGDEFKEAGAGVRTPSISLLRQRFMDCMREFVEWAVKALPVKLIANTPMTALQLSFFIVQCAEAFNKGALPEVRGLFYSVARMNCMTVKIAAFQAYLDAMKEVASGPYVNQKKLDEAHSKAVTAAFGHYESTKKLGNAEFGNAFKEELKKEISERYKEMVEMNKLKRGTNKATGIMLFSLALLSNIIGYLLSFLGLSPIVGLLSVVMWLAVIALLMWAYCIITGEFSEIRDQMDQAAESIMPVLLQLAGPAVLGAALAAGTTAKKVSEKKKQ